MDEFIPLSLSLLSRVFPSQFRCGGSDRGKIFRKLRRKLEVSEGGGHKHNVAAHRFHSLERTEQTVEEIGPLPDLGVPIKLGGIERDP